MRELILASGSKARQRLLRQVGLRFRVIESRVKEAHRIKTNCRDLVISNAVKKAKDVSRRAGPCIIIAADTVVLAGKKIIGKPRSIRDAVRSLRILSRNPQWVYTGIAVIDNETGRVYTDYEKTKVYMYPLTDAQIRHYFRKISPFNKAGSFDVQGPGSIFIDRIEGCFYNVVGLPLAKLTRMLRKMGVEAF